MLLTGRGAGRLNRDSFSMTDPFFLCHSIFFYPLDYDALCFDPNFFSCCKCYGYYAFFFWGFLPSERFCWVDAIPQINALPHYLTSCLVLVLYSLSSSDFPVVCIPYDLGFFFWFFSSWPIQCLLPTHDLSVLPLLSQFTRALLTLGDFLFSFSHTDGLFPSLMVFSSLTQAWLQCASSPSPLPDPSVSPLTLAFARCLV